jgi:hypothetical protein
LTCRKAPDSSPEQGLNDLRPGRAHARFKSFSSDLFFSRFLALSYLSLSLLPSLTSRHSLSPLARLVTRKPFFSESCQPTWTRTLLPVWQLLQLLTHRYAIDKSPRKPRNTVFDLGINTVQLAFAAVQHQPRVYMVPQSILNSSTAPGFCRAGTFVHGKMQILLSDDITDIRRTKPSNDCYTLEVLQRGGTTSTARRCWLQSWGAISRSVARGIRRLT